MARAWIQMPPGSGWGPVQAAKAEAKRLGYVVAELRGETALLRVSGARLDGEELLRVPGQR